MLLLNIILVELLKKKLKIYQYCHVKFPNIQTKLILNIINDLYKDQSLIVNHKFHYIISINNTYFYFVKEISF